MIASSALLGPAWLAASSVNRVGPDIGAPTRLVAIAAAIAVVAFVAGLLG